MVAKLTAVELNGYIDKNQQLFIEQKFSLPENTLVRVIVLYPSEEDINETEWLLGATNNPAFSFLKEKHEDIYTLEDGEPFIDEV